MAARMSGKFAIITGAGGGIGACAAALFCEHGARVLMVDSDRDSLERTLRDIRSRQPRARIAILAADVTKRTDAAAMVETAVGKFGRLNVLVNNAAVRDVETVAKSKPEAWARVFETNVIGAVNCAKASLPALRAAKGASIVNVSSCYAVRGRKGFAAYDASKAALLATTRSLATKEAEYGVRVNAVCPGGTLTPFTIGRARTRGRTEVQMRADRKSDALLGRWAEPMEVAWPILWLASDEASYITGTSLMIDGGMSIL